jgi:5-aminopentanamidase
MLSVNIKVGSFQNPSIRCDVGAVNDIINHTLEEAASLELDMVVFPELFLQGYDAGVENLRLLAVSVDSTEISTLKAMAIKYELAIAIGYSERDGSVIYNSCCLIDAAGNLILNYRK